MTFEKIQLPADLNRFLSWFGMAQRRKGLRNHELLLWVRTAVQYVPTEERANMLD